MRMRESMKEFQFPTALHTAMVARMGFERGVITSYSIHYTKLYEMVEALAKRGLSVNLLEFAPQVMPLLEGEMAGFIEKELLFELALEPVFKSNVRQSLNGAPRASVVQNPLQQVLGKTTRNDSYNFV